jgi:hypothetical protein
MTMADGYELLNWDERKRVDYADELARRRAAGEYVLDSEFQRAHDIKDNMLSNAAARAARKAGLKAADDARQAARQAERDTAAQAAEEAYLRTARLRYTGSATQWEQDKATIAREWRIRNALEGSGAVEQLKDQLRASGRFSPL